jgi:hypothetical protein
MRSVCAADLLRRHPAEVLSAILEDSGIENAISRPNSPKSIPILGSAADRDTECSATESVGFSRDLGFNGR